MKFPCCDQRRLEVLRRTGPQNAIEFLEVLDQPRRPACRGSRRCSCGCCAPASGSQHHDRQLAHQRRRAHSDVDDRLGAPGNACHHRRSRPGRRRRRARRDAGHAHREQRRFLALHARAGRQLGKRQAARRLRSNAVRRFEFSFKVECPSDFDCAAPLPVRRSCRGRGRRSTTSPRIIRASAD